MIQKAIIEIIILNIKLFAIKTVVVNGFILTVINIDENNINIEIAWIKQDIAV